MQPFLVQYKCEATTRSTSIDKNEKYIQLYVLATKLKDFGIGTCNVVYFLVKSTSSELYGFIIIKITLITNNYKFLNRPVSKLGTKFDESHIFRGQISL